MSNIFWLWGSPWEIIYEINLNLESNPDNSHVHVFSHVRAQVLFVAHSPAERTGMKHNLYEHPSFCTLHLSFLPGLPGRLDNSKMPRFKEIFGNDESANDEREKLSSSPHGPKGQRIYRSRELDVDGIPSMLTPNPLRTQGVLVR